MTFSALMDSFRLSLLGFTFLSKELDRHLAIVLILTQFVFHPHSKWSIPRSNSWLLSIGWCLIIVKCITENQWPVTQFGDGEHRLKISCCAVLIHYSRCVYHQCRHMCIVGKFEPWWRSICSWIIQIADLILMFDPSTFYISTKKIGVVYCN